MIVMMKAQKAVLSLFQNDYLIEQNDCLLYFQSFSDEQYSPINVDTPMKHSQYNIVKCHNHTYIIYNTLFNSMITLSKCEFQQYESMDFSELDIIENLVNNGFILPCFIDEYQRYEYYQNALKDMYNSVAHYTVSLTSKCNARCIYCYEEGIQQFDMCVETADRLAGVLCASEKLFDITWFGGEPLLKTDIIERITNTLKSNNKQFQAGIISNGSLLTDNIINKFSEWNIQWIQISIDGMKEEYLRRKCYYSNKTDIFDTLIENIGKLLNHNIHVDIRLNIDVENANDCIKVAEYLKKKYSSDLNLNVYPAFLSSEKYNTANNCERLKYFENIYDLYHPEEDLLTNIPKINACFFQQKDAFVIDTDGSILCCERDIGKQKTKISTVYDISTFENLNKPVYIIPEIKTCCKKCVYYPKCGGGCKALYGNLCKYDACFTERYKIEYLLNSMMNCLK